MGETVPMFKKARTVYDGGRTVYLYKRTCYSITVRLTLWMSIGGKTFDPNVLSSMNLHMVDVTVTKNLFGKCYSKIAKPLSMAKKAHTEYSGARRFDGDETKFGCTVGVEKTLHVHCKR